jgi:hypothetical protein
LTVYLNRLVVKVPCIVHHPLLGCLTQQCALLFTLWVLPRIFYNKQRVRVVFSMDSLASYCSTRNAGHPFDNLVDDEALVAAISFKFNIPLIFYLDDSRVEDELLLSQLKKPKHCRHEVEAILIDIELLRGDTAKSVEFL